MDLGWVEPWVGRIYEGVFNGAWAKGEWDPVWAGSRLRRIQDGRI